MKIPNPFRRQVEQRASYTESITELLLRQALGRDAAAVQTAAAEFAIGLVSRCFAVAEIDPMLPAVTPGYLADVGRRLMVNGNATAAIQVSSMGLTLLPCSGFDIMGGPDPATWFYRVDLPGPTRLESRTLANAGVVHHRINCGPTQPWIGVSALVHAGLSATLAAHLELRLSEEANSRVGYLLPHRDLSAEQINGLKTDLESMVGNVGLVHSQTTQFDSRGQAGGAADWSPRRFGAMIPDGNVKARRDAFLDIVGALGVPPALFEANTGTGAQEAYRQFYVATLEPYAELVAHELGLKLDRPGLVLHMDRTSGSDVVRRSTAYSKLVEAGLDDATAKRVAGVR